MVQIGLALGCMKHASEVQLVGLQWSDAAQYNGGRAISVSKLMSPFSCIFSGFLVFNDLSPFLCFLDSAENPFEFAMVISPLWANVSSVF